VLSLEGSPRFQAFVEAVDAIAPVPAEVLLQVDSRPPPGRADSAYAVQDEGLAVHCDLCRRLLADQTHACCQDFSDCVGPAARRRSRGAGREGEEEGGRQEGFVKVGHQTIIGIFDTMVQEETMVDSVPARLEELETRNAYQEATIEDLSARIYDQQQQIDRLQASFESLAEKVRGLASGGDSSPLPENERPPHY